MCELPSFSINHYAPLYPYFPCPTNECNPDGKCACDQTIPEPSAPFKADWNNDATSSVGTTDTYMSDVMDLQNMEMACTKSQQSVLSLLETTAASAAAASASAATAYALNDQNSKYAYASEVTAKASAIASAMVSTVMFAQPSNPNAPAQYTFKLCEVAAVLKATSIAAKASSLAFANDTSSTQMSSAAASASAAATTANIVHEKIRPFTPKDMWASVQEPYSRDTRTLINYMDFAKASRHQYSKNRNWKIVPRQLLKGTHANKDKWAYLNRRRHVTEQVHITYMGHLLSTDSTSGRCMICKHSCYPIPKASCGGKTATSNVKVRNTRPTLYDQCTEAHNKHRVAQDLRPKDFPDYMCVQVGQRLCAKLPKEWHKTAWLLSLSIDGSIAPMWHKTGRLRGFTVSHPHGTDLFKTAAKQHLPHFSVFFHPETVAHFTLYEESRDVNDALIDLHTIHISDRSPPKEDVFDVTDTGALIGWINRMFSASNALERKISKFMGFCYSAGLLPGPLPDVTEVMTALEGARMSMYPSLLNEHQLRQTSERENLYESYRIIMNNAYDEWFGPLQKYYENDLSDEVPQWLINTLTAAGVYDVPLPTNADEW